MKKEILIRHDQSGALITFDDGSALINPQKPSAYLNLKCLHNGSDMKGRTGSFCYLLNVKQKPAVLISEVSGEIWFPTLSAKQKDCVWIRYDEILEVKALDPQACEVIFFSGLRIRLETDARVIRSQMKRCREFLELLHRTDTAF